MQTKNQEPKNQTQEQNQSVARMIENIHKLAKTPKKCSIDEVAHAYFQSLRVNSWEEIGKDFGGYKIGALYAFVLELVEKHIADSLDAREIAKEMLFRKFEGEK